MKKLLVLVAFVLTLASQVLAQNNRTVTGKIIDETGVPLAGVTVAIPGTRTGTVTNATGLFSLNIPEGTKAVKVSFIGYESQTVSLTDASDITIKIKPDNKSLSEVVVVGYGTQKRVEITGSIGTVKGTAIAQQPVQSFDGALGGRVAGVQITVPNGVVNNPPVFRIRGTNSISLSSYPLIVIDGVVSFTGDIGSTAAPTNPLAGINPNDIESIDIAKDAAATSIYGSRGANGVVFVTTKKGKQGKAKVTYSGWVGEAQAQRLPKLLNAQQYVDNKNLGIAHAAADGKNLGTSFAINEDKNGNPINTNWLDVVYRKAVSHSHAISISGANDKTTYYMSAGFTDQQGILRRNEFVRKNILFNIDQKVGSILTIGGKISYANEKNLSANSSGSLEGEAFNSGGLARLAFLTGPNVSPYLNDGSYNVDGGVIGTMGNVGVQSGIYNPQVILDLDRSNSINNHIQSSIYAQLRPFSWVTLRTQYGIDQNHIDNELYENPISGDASPTAEAINATGIYNRWVWDNTIQFDKSFGKHSFSLLGGTEEEKSTKELFGIDRTGQNDPLFNNVEGGWQTTNPISSPVNTYNYLVSEFGRLNYNYAEKYFISANLRRDGNSNLGKNAKYGNFYGLSAGWTVSNENFWSHSSLGKTLNDLKLKASYGKVGNASISDFKSFSFYGSKLYNGDPTLYYSQAGNDYLTWETSKQLNIGLSFGLFDSRLHGEFNWYRNNVDGLILFVPMPPSAGVPTTIPKNIGSMYNTGEEIALGATIINHKNFTWNSDFNISFNRNKITNLYDGATQIISQTSGLESVSVQKVGDPIGMIFVTRTAGVDPANGKRIFVAADGQKFEFSLYGGGDGLANKWMTTDGKTTTRSVSGADAVAYKKTNPTFFGGWDNTFRYKSFELGILATFQAGNYVYYGTNAGLKDQRYWNNSTDVLHAWNTPNQKTDVPRVVYGDNISNGSSFPLDVNVFKGDFIKLRSVTLAYYLPGNVLTSTHLSSVKLYVSSNNLGIWTKYPGPDPEVSSNGNNPGLQGIDRNTLANGRTLTFGLNVGF
ncbi:SusC/RagA family TonB-linked outer membrane protein [Chitinophaga costaii]|nr:SusC/RagA family TonB-linked outer membrane protein [Chitinophaga costaii]PUZ27178.1 SusC/RagA family TonB-linked outer membrane protein [Chitinophaga costaii]